MNLLATLLLLITASPSPADVPATPEPTVFHEVAEWLTLPEVSKSADLAKNVENSYLKGCANYAFTAVDLPFLSGKIEHRIQAGLSIPVSGKWSHETAIGRCYMTVRLNPDGTFISSKGGCINNR